MSRQYRENKQEIKFDHHGMFREQAKHPHGPDSSQRMHRRLLVGHIRHLLDLHGMYENVRLITLNNAFFAPNKFSSRWGTVRQCHHFDIMASLIIEEWNFRGHSSQPPPTQHSHKSFPLPIVNPHMTHALDRAIAIECSSSIYIKNYLHANRR